MTNPSGLLYNPGSLGQWWLSQADSEREESTVVLGTWADQQPTNPPIPATPVHIGHTQK